VRGVSEADLSGSSVTKINAESIRLDSASQGILCSKAWYFEIQLCQDSQKPGTCSNSYSYICINSMTSDGIYYLSGVPTVIWHGLCQASDSLEILNAEAHLELPCFCFSGICWIVL
jgi:hypothetical protein